MKNSPKQSHTGSREISGDGSPATGRMAKVMQEVAQHTPTSSNTSQNKNSTPAYSSPSAAKDSPKTVPAHCLMKGNNSSLTNRSNSYSFGMEGQHMSTSHRASQESIHSDIYPSSAHDRALAWKKVQGRTSSADNGLNLEKSSNTVEHKAVVHQSQRRTLAMKPIPLSTSA
ncbi:hypothetical protein BSL78_10249 [Apostichopus japonicus]|uniref:Uncharacterized protein n=1 Tax=Stichopus japonicus TaxID=307972 RepID=A0A2G8KXS2_STIJA|nr:hypothetical protein BSL78_10249 [Apostichopus japonicus]